MRSRRDRASCTQLGISCALVSLPDQWLRSLVWEWNYICAAYNIRKWRPTQRTATEQSWRSYINQGKFVAMKTRSGCKAPRCDKHQFCNKMAVTTWTVFEISLFEQSGLNEEWEKWHFRYRTLSHLAVFCVAFALTWVLLTTEALKEED